MLRCLLGENICSWESRLCQTEFAHNHASNRSSGFSPFEIVYSLLPRGPLDFTSVPDVRRLHGCTVEFVEALNETHQQARTQLELSAHKYKSRADSKRCEVIFEPGEMVWVVLTRDCMSLHEYNKLRSWKIGPVEIVERINNNAYRLKLPYHIKTADVFNVKY